MSKETKIGLAAVGVLLLAFGGLLLRRLTATDTPAAEQALVSAAEAAQKPAPATASPDLLPGRRDFAVTPASAAQSVAPVEQPAAVTLAAAEEVTDPSPRHDRYATPDDGRAAPRSANPFQHERDASADAAQADSAGEPALLPQQPTEAMPLETPRERLPRDERGPLKRASAEESLAAMPAEENSDSDIPTVAVGQDYATEAQAVDATETVSAADANAADANTAQQPAALRDEDQAAVPVAEANNTPAPPRAVQSQWQSAAPVQPTPPENGKYTVQPNDTLSSIAEKMYGSERYFKALQEHNRAKYPNGDRLAVGSVVSVPPVTTLEQNHAALCPKQRRSVMVKPRTMQASTRQRAPGGDNLYVVQEGDTLFDIARYELGKASRWAEIYELNRDALGEDFDYLQPGTELTMPPKTRPTESFTRQQDSGVQR